MDLESGSRGPLFFVPDFYPPKAMRTADVATISNMSRNSFIISVIIYFGCKTMQQSCQIATHDRFNRPNCGFF